METPEGQRNHIPGAQPEVLPVQAVNQTAAQAAEPEPANASGKKPKNSVGQRISTIIVVAVLLVGVGLLAYPTVSDWWNSLHQSRAISGYIEAVNDLSPEEYERIWTDAEEYNASLLGKIQTFQLNDQEQAYYDSQLNIEGNGIMAYLEVPAINVKLPIYHGLDEGILQVAIGHIEGTSLPVGGESTHCVVSGHRGLPSARLLTDLDRISEGDVFMFHTLNETLTYEVDQIRIVEPSDTKDITIEPGKDLATMITCTPYGINSHRMLVRGHRVPTIDADRVVAEAEQISPFVVAATIGIPVMFVVLVVALFVTRKRPDKKAAAKKR